MLFIVVLSLIVSPSALVPLPNTQLEGSVSISAQDNIKPVKKQLELLPTYPDFKQYGRQRVVLNNEYWLSKKDSAYTKKQLAVARYLNLEPLVDTISEDKKYDNDGILHGNVAKKLINFLESISNGINTLAELPNNAKEHIQKNANAALNALGSKIVGI